MRQIPIDFIIYKNFKEDKFLLGKRDPNCIYEQILGICDANGRLKEDTCLLEYVEFENIVSQNSFSGNIRKITITDYFSNEKDITVTTTFYRRVYFEKGE